MRDLNRIKRKQLSISEYEKGIKDAIKAVENTKRPGCLCGHFDPYDGSCNPSTSDYINNIKKLLK